MLIFMMQVQNTKYFVIYQRLLFISVKYEILQDSNNNNNNNKIFSFSFNYYTFTQ